MSELAARTFCVMLHANVLTLDGRQVMSKKKVTNTLVDLLVKGGWNRSQARESVRQAWAIVLHGQPKSTNPLHESCVGVAFACRASQHVGFPTAVDSTVPGISGVVEVGGAEHQIIASREAGADAGADRQLVPVRCRCEAPADLVHVVSDDEEHEVGDGSNNNNNNNNNNNENQQQLAAVTGRVRGRGRGRGRAAAMQVDDPDQLALLSPNVLAARLCSNQIKNQRNELRTHALQNKVRCLKRQLAPAKAQGERKVALLKEKYEKENVFKLQKLGKKREGKGGRWSLQSKFSMGIRTCLSTIAAADFSVMSMVDLSKQTVLRAQCVSGAAVISVFRSFCAEGLALCLKENEPAGEADVARFQVFGVGFRSDGTNTNIWHRKKLHVCEADVMYLTDVGKLQEGNFAEAMSARHCVSFARNINQLEFLNLFLECIWHMAYGLCRLRFEVSGLKS